MRGMCARCGWMKKRGYRDNTHIRFNRGREELRRVRVPRARARQDRSSGPWAKDQGGTSTPLPDEAVVPVSVFNDHM